MLEVNQKEVERAVSGLLLALKLPIDHNLEDTPKRIARMYINEVFKGLYEPMPAVTAFPNVHHLNELYIVKDITIRSTCAHHFAPIIGKCHIGVIPTDKLIGLSKFHRLCDWVASRPQIQEEMTTQIADLLEELIAPLGLAVIIEAKHTCVGWRGVKDYGSNMITSVMRGVMFDDPKARAEFLELVK